MRTKQEYRTDNCEKIHQYRIDNCEKIHQYRIDNKVIINKYAKEYYIDNKEKINQTIYCCCGITYTHHNKSRHFKTNKHINSITIQFKIIEEMHKNRKQYIFQPLPELII